MRISRLMGLTAAVMLSCGGVLGGSVLSANAAPNAVEAHSVVLAPRAAITAAAANGDTIPVKGSNPTAVAFSPDGSYAYVTSAASTTVTKINTADASTSAITVGTTPRGVAFSPDGTFAYVANFGSNTVTKINTADNTTSSIAVGTQPVGVAFSPDGSFAYVTNYGSNNVTKIIVATGA